MKKNKRLKYITFHLGMPAERYEDLRDMTGVDLILNNSWYIDYADFVKYKEEYKKILTDTVYDILDDLFTKKTIIFIKFIREDKQNGI